MLFFYLNVISCPCMKTICHKPFEDHSLKSFQIFFFLIFQFFLMYSFHKQAYFCKDSQVHFHDLTSLQIQAVLVFFCFSSSPWEWLSKLPTVFGPTQSWSDHFNPIRIDMSCGFAGRCCLLRWQQKVLATSAEHIYLSGAHIHVEHHLNWGIKWAWSRGECGGGGGVFVGGVHGD